MSKEEIKYEIQTLENLKADSLERSQELLRRHDLITGIVLGLIYGIIGNLFVQFFYPVIEKIVLANFDNVFWADLIVSVAALIGIVLTTIKYSKQLRLYADGQKLTHDRMEILEKAIQRRKYQLEQMS